MYYIINQTKQIIAADKKLLALLGVKSIDELYRKLILGDITLSLSENNSLTITTPLNDKSYKISKSTLLSILGKFTLIKLQVAKEDTALVESNLSEEENLPMENRVVTPLSDSANISSQDNLALNSDKEDRDIALDEELSISNDTPKEEEENYDDIMAILASQEEEISLTTSTEDEESISNTKEERRLDELPNLDDSSKDEDELNDDDIMALLNSHEDENLLPEGNDLESIEDKRRDTNEIALLDDDLTSIQDRDIALDEELSISNDTPKEEEENYDDIINLFDLDEDKAQPIDNNSEEKSKTVTKMDDKSSSLTISNSAKEPTDEISLPINKVEENDNSPIIIDIEKISQEIGISTEDYNRFLNAYIDTAISLENDFKSTELQKRSSAIKTLLHLSQVLHLSLIDEILSKIGQLPTEEQKHLIDSFYTTLARVTTYQIETSQSSPKEPSREKETKYPVETQSDSSLLISETEPTQEREERTKGFGTIDLSDVKPIYFDFQVEEAATDLNLPVDLIEEFVRDFIKQAHIETKKMLKAYEEGDLVTIQKIGHLLKGASSNLRIKALSDTLYNIQFCEESSKLEELIKEYWGHFLSFETQINIISK